MHLNCRQTSTMVSTSFIAFHLYNRLFYYVQYFQMAFVVSDFVINNFYFRCIFLNENFCLKFHFFGYELRRHFLMLFFVVRLQFQFNGFNMMFPEARPFNNSYRCYSVSMLPGNERQDVEKGGKSEYCAVNCVHLNGIMNSVVFLSHHATIGSRSIDTIECCVSDVVQTDKQQEKSYHTCWRFGICCWWRQNLYSILGKKSS